MAVALVTGGSRGIGRELARRLAGEGYRVAIVARTAADLDRTAEEIRAAGGTCLSIVADVSDPDAVEAVFARVHRELGPPDVVIHCVAILRTGRFDEIPPEDYRRSMEVNYLGSVHVARAAVSRFSAAGGGRLVQVASVIALRSFPGFAAYAPTKWALRAFHETLELELAGTPIRLSIVYPPITDTPMVRGLPPDRPRVYDAFDAVPAERVAAMILRGIRGGRRRIFVRRIDWLFFHLARLAPETTGFLLDRYVALRSPGRRTPR